MRIDRLIDAADRAVMLLLYAQFFARFTPAALEWPWYIFLLVETTLMMGFIIFRPWNRPITTKAYPIALGFIGTVFLLLLQPQGFRPENATFGGILMMVGSLVSICGALALNLRFSMVPANRGVQVKGPYAIIRHPVYTGYVITYTGFLITNPIPWNFAVYTGFFALLFLRAIEEEKFLAEDPAYVAYRQKVRFRVIPGVF